MDHPMVKIWEVSVHDCVSSWLGMFITSGCCHNPSNRANNKNTSIILYTYIHDYVYTVNIKQLQTLQFLTQKLNKWHILKKPSENQGTKQHPPKPWWTSQYTTLDPWRSWSFTITPFVGRNTKNLFFTLPYFWKKKRPWSKSQVLRHRWLRNNLLPPVVFFFEWFGNPR